MKRHILFLTLSMALLFTILFTLPLHAATIELRMDVPKHDLLKGWKIYQLYHDATTAPSVIQIMNTPDYTTNWEVFSSANEVIPALQRNWGCRILPKPGAEDTEWEVTLYIYIPGTDPKLNQKLYFVVTSTGLNGSESAPSNVASVVTQWPGKPGVPDIELTVNESPLPATNVKTTKLALNHPHLLSGRRTHGSYFSPVKVAGRIQR